MSFPALMIMKVVVVFTFHESVSLGPKSGRLILASRSSCFCFHVPLEAEEEPRLRLLLLLLS